MPSDLQNNNWGENDDFWFLFNVHFFFLCAYDYQLKRKRGWVAALHRTWSKFSQGFPTEDLYSWGYHIDVGAYRCAWLRKIGSDAFIRKNEDVRWPKSLEINNCRTWVSNAESPRIWLLNVTLVFFPASSRSGRWSFMYRPLRLIPFRGCICCIIIHSNLYHK